MKKQILSNDEVIEQIGEILKEADGDFIEHIANQVLGNKVVYKEDSIFEMTIIEDDNFICEDCNEVFDIEDSVKIFDSLYCPTCSNEAFLGFDPQEQQRRDEKNGLYPDKSDISN